MKERLVKSYRRKYVANPTKVGDGCCS